MNKDCVCLQVTIAFQLKTNFQLGSSDSPKQSTVQHDFTEKSVEKTKLSAPPDLHDIHLAVQETARQTRECVVNGFVLGHGSSIHGRQEFRFVALQNRFQWKRGEGRVVFVMLCLVCRLVNP